MKITIRGGSMSHEETLCSSCGHSTIIRGRRQDDEIIDCHIIGLGRRRITFRVTSCSAYIDARLPSVMQLMETAWVLRKATKRRPAGFIHGKDLRMEELAHMAAMVEMDGPNEIENGNEEEEDANYAGS